MFSTVISLSEKERGPVADRCVLWLSSVARNENKVVNIIKGVDLGHHHGHLHHETMNV